MDAVVGVLATKLKLPEDELRRMLGAQAELNQRLRVSDLRLIVEHFRSHFHTTQGLAIGGTKLEYCDKIVAFVRSQTDSAQHANAQGGGSGGAAVAAARSPPKQPTPSPYASFKPQSHRPTPKRAHEPPGAVQPSPKRGHVVSPFFGEARSALPARSPPALPALPRSPPAAHAPPVLPPHHGLSRPLPDPSRPLPAGSPSAHRDSKHTHKHKHKHKRRRHHQPQHTPAAPAPVAPATPEQLLAMQQQHEKQLMEQHQLALVKQQQEKPRAAGVGHFRVKREIAPAPKPRTDPIQPHEVEKVRIVRERVDVSPDVALCMVRRCGGHLGSAIEAAWSYHTELDNARAMDIARKESEETHRIEAALSPQSKPSDDTFPNSALLKLLPLQPLLDDPGSKAGTQVNQPLFDALRKRGHSSSLASKAARHHALLADAEGYLECCVDGLEPQLPASAESSDLPSLVRDLLRLEKQAVKWYSEAAELYLQEMAARIKRVGLTSFVVSNEMERLKAAMYSMPTLGSIPDAFLRCVEKARATSLEADGVECVVTVGNRSVFLG